MADQVVESVRFGDGVVVGVDGSGSSVSALRHAADEACRRDVVLHVVRAWSMRTVPRPADCPPGRVPSIVEYEQAALRQTKELVDDVLGDTPKCEVGVHVVHAPAAQALMAAAEKAELLVVGHRGGGGFGGLLLGSVAEQCVRHAHCPVLVVRPH
jgi:nucleotide-binding universal stress UspA family protein